MKEALKLALDLAIMHHSDDGYAELRLKVRQLAKEALAPTSTPCEVQPEQEPAAWIEHDDETAEPCPSCGKPLQSASGGGVVCSERCGYWFCF